MSKRFNRKPVYAPKFPKNPNATVQQQFQEDADINTMIRRHNAGPGRFGQPMGVDPNATRQPRFMELPSESYHESLNRVQDAKNLFMSYPARVRARFGNDPFQMLRFIEDPRNIDEAQRLGLVEARPDLMPETAPKGPLDPENVEGGHANPDPEANPTFNKKGGK